MTKQIIIGLFLIVLMGCLFSCGKDEEKTMKVSPVAENDESFVLDGNKVTLYFPLERNVHFAVTGAEGGLSGISPADRETLAAGWISEGFYLFPLKIGETTVSIKDERGRELILDVENVYREDRFIADSIEIYVSGDRLTQEDECAIIRKAESLLPVQIGGGYRFVYTDEHRSEGFVEMYPHGWDKDFVSGSFCCSSLMGSRYVTYTLQFDGEPITIDITEDEKGSYLSYNAYIQPSLQDEYPGIRIFGIDHVCRKNPITPDSSGES